MAFIPGDAIPGDFNDINPDLQEPNGITELFQNKYVCAKNELFIKEYAVQLLYHFHQIGILSILCVVIAFPTPKTTQKYVKKKKNSGNF